MRRFILLIVLLLTASTSLTAQDDATPAWLADGWTYERSCLPEAPTEPPDDWSFEGTLLYWGDYGIHGYRQGWETTRILAFVDDSTNFYSVATAFSPDLKRYARVEGQAAPIVDEHGTWSNTYVDHIEVFQLSPDDPHQRYRVEWFYWYADNIWRNEGEPPLVWRDNTTVVFTEHEELGLLNTETREKTLFTGDLGIPENALIATAPDLTRYFDVDYENTSTGTHYFYPIIDTATGEAVKTLPGTLFSSLQYNERENSIDLWSPDSSRFLIYSRESEDAPYYMSVMDRNGEKNIPILAPDQDGLHILDNRWTAASNAVQLIWAQQADTSGKYWNYTYRQGIAFPEQKLLVDLCLSKEASPGYIKVFSYDGSQIALNVTYKNQKWLSIFNWRTGEWYVVKPIDGGVFGWATW